MPNRVDRKKTEISDSEMKSAITAAWRTLFGNDPLDRQMALIMSHIDLETGHRKSLWNYNVGNITTSGATHKYFDDMTTDEQIQPGVWKKLNLKYKAYDNLQEGIIDYLNLLSKNSRYSEAWQHIIQPDPAAYSKALKAGGYYTASEKPYTKTLEQLFNKRIKNKENLLNNNELSKKLNDLDDAEFEELLSILKEEPELLQLVNANNKNNYFKYLPHNNVNIKLFSDKIENTVEFARVLSLALDATIQSKSFIHTNGTSVELDCAVPGPDTICIKAINDIINSVQECFYNSTIKIGGVNINYNINYNTKSKYPEINLKTASIKRRIFLLKFI